MRIVWDKVKEVASNPAVQMAGFVGLAVALDLAFSLRTGKKPQSGKFVQNVIQRILDYYEKE